MPSILIKYNKNYPVLAVYLTIIILIFGLIFMVSVGTALENHQIAAVREGTDTTKTMLLKTFGGFIICERNKTISKKFSPVSGAHYTVANRFTFEVMSEFYGQLPEAMQAKSRQDLTYVICIQKDSVPDGKKEEYGNTIYSCQRHRRFWAIKVYEVKTENLVGQTTIYGSAAPPCPKKSNEDVDPSGDDPSFNQVVDWIQSSAK